MELKPKLVEFTKQFLDENPIDWVDKNNDPLHPVLENNL